MCCYFSFNLFLQNMFMKNDLLQSKLIMIGIYTMYQTLEFYLIRWCGNFVDMYSFHKALGELPKTHWRLCVFTKYLNQKVRWDFGILHSAIQKWSENSLQGSLLQKPLKVFFNTNILLPISYFIPKFHRKSIQSSLRYLSIAVYLISVYQLYITVLD